LYTALRATSQTLANQIRLQLESDSNLGPFFNAGLGGTMIVSLDTPKEMKQRNKEGLSVWLYRVIRDEERLNAPPFRRGFGSLERVPLPVRLHYLITPNVDSTDALEGSEMEQVILGKVMQTFHDHPTLRGSDLQDDFSGTEVELNVRLESLTMDEIAKVWDALERSYQLSLSYEVGVVYIESEIEPEKVAPVEVALPEYGVIVSSKPGQ
jgi:hypothetical protein